MCGIVGFVSQKEEPLTKEVLEAMNQKLTHRGPDESGVFFQGKVGLAMSRLQVIDLKTGSQPMSDAQADLQVVFNGEIYNFKELRENLKKQGANFRSESDTEVLLHLYKAYGENLVEHLRGMFAFALWDGKKQELLLARDRFGQKPLYYAIENETLLFASELKSLLLGLKEKPKISLESIQHYLTLQYVPDPWSAYEGVLKLPAAYTLKWKSGKVEIKPYWELHYEPKTNANEKDLGQELERHLRDSVQLRLISDVPLGIHLSGGVDSSIITALACELKEKVETFSVGFQEAAFSELDYARQVASAFKTKHHEFILTDDALPQVMDQVVEAFDEPFADPSAIPVYYLSQMTRQHVTVALNGDGGDELFAGYLRYRVDRAAKLYATLPDFLTQKLLPSIVNLFPTPMNKPPETSWTNGLKRLKRVAKMSDKVNMIRWGSYFDEDQQRGLWKDNVLSRIISSVEQQATYFDELSSGGWLDRTLQVDVAHYLPGDLLVKADRMSMAHSLEARSPFLDHKLAEFIAQLPENMKMKGKMQKYLLRKTFEKKLPPALFERPKRGFGIPLGAWFRGRLRGWLHERLFDSQASWKNYFNEDYVSQLLKEHERGIENHGNRLWALVCFELWLKRNA